MIGCGVGGKDETRSGDRDVITARTVAEFEQGFLQTFKDKDLYFILAKVESGAGDVPAAALDSQEDKYLFVRYIEKSENLKISLRHCRARASQDPRETMFTLGSAKSSHVSYGFLPARALNTNRWPNSGPHPFPRRISSGRFLETFRSRPRIRGDRYR